MQDKSPESNEVDFTKFTILNKISQNSNSEVYLISEKETEKNYAAKIIFRIDNDKYQSNNLKELYETIKKEFKIIINCNHPTINKYLGYSSKSISDGKIILIMEYAENQSLADVIEQINNFNAPSNYSNTSKQKIITGVAYGLKCLHNNDILHGNINANNILIDENLNPLLTDYVISKEFHPFFTPSPYTAPEVFQNKQYNKKSEVYSFAFIMYEILTNSHTFYRLYKSFYYQRYILQEKWHPEFDIDIKESFQTLFKQCWSHDPEKRPSFDEIFEKLTNFDDDDNCIMDDVDLDEFRIYVEDITQDGVPNFKKDKNYNELISALEKSNVTLKSDIENLKNENEKNLQTISLMKAENKKLKQKNKDLKKENKKYNEKMTKFKDKNEKYKTENKKLKRENKQNLEAISTLESQNEKCMKSNEKLKKEINDQLERISEIEKKSILLENDYKALKIENTQLINKINSFENNIQLQLSEKVEKEKVDICFVLDATESMKYFSSCIIDIINDISVDIKNSNPCADIQYGAVIFHDPVDWKELPPTIEYNLKEYTEEDKEIDEFIFNSLYNHSNNEENEKLFWKAYQYMREQSGKKYFDGLMYEINARAEKKLIDEMIYHDTYYPEYLNECKFYESLIDEEKYPINENKSIEFTKNAEKIICELLKVKFGGGNDSPEDWVGAIECAFRLKWREQSKKCIVFISNSNAHGKLFCGYDNHNGEEQILVDLIKKMANEKYFFFGCNVLIHRDREKNLKTFQEIENIYKNCQSNLYSICNLIIERTLWVNFQNKIPPGLFDYYFEIDQLINFISGNKKKISNSRK